MILNADALHIPLANGTVQTCVTSPPYFALRDYGVPGQIGMEATPEEYVESIVAVFREVWRVLRDDGTLWLNLGDSYAGGNGNGGVGPASKKQVTNRGSYFGPTVKSKRMERGAGRWGGGDRKMEGLQPKQLIGIPWRVAFALQAEGWYLRSDIIWHKPNPMPESVTDRPTKSHEYIFLLSKSAQYYYDAEAIKEPATENNWASRYDRAKEGQKAYPTEKVNGIRSKRDSFKREGSKREQVIPGQTAGTHRPDRAESNWDTSTRNKRSVWTVTTQPYAAAHFATYPPKLIEPCILAGSKEGDVVLDPFSGSGTTGEVSIRLRRRYAGLELNWEYIGLQRERTTTDVMLPNFL